MICKLLNTSHIFKRNWKKCDRSFRILKNHPLSLFVHAFCVGIESPFFNNVMDFGGACGVIPFVAIFLISIFNFSGLNEVFQTIIFRPHHARSVDFESEHRKCVRNVYKNLINYCLTFGNLPFAFFAFSFFVSGCEAMVTEPSPVTTQPQTTAEYTIQISMECSLVISRICLEILYNFSDIKRVLELGSSAIQTLKEFCETLTLHHCYKNLKDLVNEISFRKKIVNSDFYRQKFLSWLNQEDLENLNQQSRVEFINNGLKEKSLIISTLTNNFFSKIALELLMSIRKVGVVGSLEQISVFSTSCISNISKHCSFIAFHPKYQIVKQLKVEVQYYKKLVNGEIYKTDFLKWLNENDRAKYSEYK